MNEYIQVGSSKKIVGGRGTTKLTIMTLAITAFSIMTLRLRDLFVTLSIMTFSINDTDHNNTPLL